MVNRLFSNTIIAAIAIVLMAVIVLDGTLYNRPPQSQNIYTLPAHPDISISHNQQSLMAFQHRDGRWHLTYPFAAPVNTTRIDALLHSNTQSARSYNKNEINAADLFSDAIVLRTAEREFQFGELEPVSGLRYVSANKKIYLQSDTVIPMLRAGPGAFVDLTITSTPTSVLINDEVPSGIESWSHLTALGLVATEQLESIAKARITINNKQHDSTVYHLHSYNGSAALVPDNAEYGYVLSIRQSEDLGISRFL